MESELGGITGRPDDFQSARTGRTVGDVSARSVPDSDYASPREESVMEEEQYEGTFFFNYFH